MANAIMISGESGCGKSTSIKYLDPKETFLISCTNKQPQIPGYRNKYIKMGKDNLDTANWLVSNSYQVIGKILNFINIKRQDIKVIIIDDLNYLLSYSLFDQALDKGWEKYTIQASDYEELIRIAQNLRDDLFVVFMSHIENYGTELEPKWRLWTSGKMLTSKINLDGLFTYNLYAERELDPETGELIYHFRTRSNGNDTCRSTAGCFADKYIEPNLKKIIDRIKHFEETGEEEVKETVESNPEKDLEMNFDEIQESN